MGLYKAERRSSRRQRRGGEPVDASRLGSLSSGRCLPEDEAPAGASIRVAKPHVMLNVQAF